MKPAPTLTNILQRLLGWRLLLISMLIILGIAVLLGYFRYQEIRSEQRLQAASISSYVQSHIKSQMQTIRFLSRMVLYPEFEAIASHYKAHAGLFKRFLVLDESGRIRQVLPEMEAFQDYSRMIPATERLETSGEFYFSTPYMKPDEYTVTVSLSYTGHFSKILVAELDLDSLQEFITRITRMQKDDRVFVLDGYGNVLAHPESSVVAGQYNLGHLRPVARALQGQTGFLGMGRKYGELYLFSAEKVPEAEWTVFTAWSVKGQLLPVLMPIGFAGFLLFGFLGLLVWNVTWRVRQDVIDPLVSFTGEVEKLPRGAFDMGVQNYVSSFYELQALSSSFQDMAETVVRREETLRRSEQRLAGILDSLDAAVYVADMHSDEILFINSYIREKRGDVIGRKCWEVFQNAQQGPCSFCRKDELKNQSGTPEPARWEYQDQETGSSYDCRAMAIPWSDGRMVRIVISTDITERRDMEARLHQAHKMQAVGTLAGGIAHDFNNILQVISGHVRMLLEKKAQDDPDIKRIVQIQQAGERAAKLVRQLLTFSREIEGQFRPVDLNREAAETASLLKKSFPDQIALELRLDDGIKPVQGDPAQLEQVLLNLCNNALDAMPEGGRLTIETSMAHFQEPQLLEHFRVEPGSYVVLSISDTGEGIDEDIRQKIFDPFFTTKEPGKGTGLGLASVFGIVENHQGYIECRSSPGQGAKFRIYLPVAPEEEACFSDREEKKADSYEHILVVDDEPALRELTREALEEAGYRASCAESGEQALEMYQKNQDSIALIIMDINMPGMGGYECIQRLLELDSEVSILVVSGYSPEERLRQYLKSGRVGFMAKPYRVPELLSRVREAIDRPVQDGQ